MITQALGHVLFVFELYDILELFHLYFHLLFVDVFFL